MNEEDGNELGAKEHSFDAKPIDPSKGSTAGYIAKYISKGIDGHGIDKDLYGKHAKSSASRVKAWAFCTPRIDQETGDGRRIYGKSCWIPYQRLK